MRGKDADKSYSNPKLMHAGRENLESAGKLMNMQENSQQGYEGCSEIRRKSAGNDEHDEDLQDLHLQNSRKMQHVHKHKLSIAL